MTRRIRSAQEIATHESAILRRKNTARMRVQRAEESRMTERRRWALYPKWALPGDGKNARVSLHWKTGE